MFRDSNYLLAGDKINDVISLPAEKVKLFFSMGVFAEMKTR